jgi:hypothetical protein
MEEWNRIVRQTDGDPRVAEAIFRTMSRMRIKEAGKFQQRMGPEYESMLAHLSDTYPLEAIQTWLAHDDFFTTTWNLQGYYKR